ncbi:dihydrofolate reductase family protein [Candidatus Uhrbacteria bacterium]|nr:dihydrofolate reductase family protein [Candidatus Uhrbacteria bacterium]
MDIDNIDPDSGAFPSPMISYLDRDERHITKPPLPNWVTRAYGGNISFPDAQAERPYLFANFVQGMDGVVSFQLPGQASGGPVSGFNAQDQFLMAVLRAAADAVMVGAGTLRAEPEHRWIPEHIYPKGGQSLWTGLRKRFGKQPNPINAFVTASGDINLGAVVFQQSNIRCVVFTTKTGAERIAGMRAAHPDAKLEVIVVGDRTVDLPEMLRRFRTEFGVEHLLVEGGPQLMGDFLSQDLMDEVFLTIAPQVIGTDGNRPTFAKGKPFTPQTARWWKLVSAKGWGDYLYTRYRFKR